MTKIIYVKACCHCPHIKKGTSYSLDGFDRGFDISCDNKNGKVIAEFIERPRELEETEIPKWCPLKDKD